jgi:type VI secretion system protein ImpF
MPDLTPFEKLQPCLLDRLTDDSPGYAQESRGERVISLTRYKEAVMRDLLWLFNTTAHPPGAEIYQFPAAAASVMNFGCRNLCGLTLGSLDLLEWERHLLSVIRTFEPRIIPHTASVRGAVDQWNRNPLSFDIRGELWAKPIPEQVWLKTAVDLDTGRFLFGDRLHE